MFNRFDFGIMGKFSVVIKKKVISNILKVILSLKSKMIKMNTTVYEIPDLTMQRKYISNDFKT